MHRKSNSAVNQYEYSYGYPPKERAAINCKLKNENALQMFTFREWGQPLRLTPS
jgi:hypothetical protein